MAKAKFTREATFSEKRGKSASTEKAPRITDLIDIHSFKENKWTEVRLVGPVFSYATHWVATLTKDGKPTKFPVPCLSWDDVSESHDSDKTCPYCDMLPEGSKDVQTGKRPDVKYYVNAIVRTLQEREPKKNILSADEKESGFCDAKTETEAWTPIRALALPSGVANTLHTLSETNVHGKKGAKKAYPLSDPQYGRDLKVYVDPNKPPAQRYNVQIGDHTPLEEHEEGYLLWNIEGMTTPESEKDALVNVKRVLTTIGEDGGDEDEEGDDDDDDDAPRRGKKAAKGKPAGKPAKKGYSDDGDDDDDDDDEEDDEPPRRGKPPVKKSGAKKSSRDDDDDDDDDEEDEPAPKKGKGKPAPKKSSRDDDDDEEDDEDEPKAKKKSKPDPDDDDDDDDDDEPAAKKGKPAAAKGKRRPEPDDDDDDDDDEEDEPAPKKGGKKPVGKPAKKSSRDDDDDDDDEEGDDDEEDDEPAAKKGKGKAPVKRRRPSDDDDDDEGEDD